MNLKNRLKKNEEFKEVLDCKDLKKLKSCNIFFKETTGSYRFGVSVSKKIGNAVIRNLTKRRIRACLREIDDKNFNHYYKLVIIAKSSIIEMTYSEIKNEISKALLTRFIGE
jgi:ribonuclease P protein component